MPSQVSIDILLTRPFGADELRRDIPLLMTFRSTYQSPRTVNKNAREFVIGTVRLNSIPPLAFKYLHAAQISLRGRLLLDHFSNDNKEKGQQTSLPNQQEKPNTPGQINHQWNRISRIPQYIRQ